MHAVAYAIPHRPSLVLLQCLLFWNGTLILLLVSSESMRMGQLCFLHLSQELLDPKSPVKDDKEESTAHIAMGEKGWKVPIYKFLFFFSVFPLTDFHSEV